MKVKCKWNKGMFLPSNMFFEGSFCKKTSEFPLEIDKEYIVYAITIQDGYAWYCLCDENFTYHPNWRPSPLFEIIDNRLSRYWVFSYQKETDEYATQTVWAYPEWANDPEYYDKLFEGNEKELHIFQAYQDLMFLEFPNSHISEYAKIGDEKWLICPVCFDAWESVNDRDALVRCPKCMRTSNNPRYKF